MQTINQELINDFLSKRNVFAVVGVSKESEKYGNKVYFDLKRAGYSVYPVNPNIETHEGDKCYPDLASLPDGVTGAVIVTNGSHTLGLIKEGESKGIKHFWVQQGAQSDEALEYAKDTDSNIIFKECILMYAEPVGALHKFHRWFYKLFGKYPKLHHK